MHLISQIQCTSGGCEYRYREKTLIVYVSILYSLKAVNLYSIYPTSMRSSPHM